MSSVYTPRQVRFIHIFMHHMQPMLKSFLHIESNTPNPSSSLDHRIDGVASGVNLLSAAVSVAGIAGSAPTLGISIGSAAACIVLLQTINGGYQFVKRHIDHKDDPFSPDETKLDEIHLSLTILLRQVACLASVRYRHFIDEILEEASVTTFAIYVADRAIKKLTTELAEKDDLTTSLSAEIFLDYFMAKATLSIIQQSTTVKVKEAYYETTRCSPSLAVTYAKLACSRAGLAVYDVPSPGLYTLYVSSPSNMLSRNKTTLQQQYGYATVPQTELSSETAAVNRKSLKPLSPEAMQEILDKNKQHFSSYYQVSRQQVSDYMTGVKSAIHSNQSVKSLNEYLSESLNSNLIAACNDDRLSGLDLSDGNFSEVWFVGLVDLSDCNLRNTVWTKAYLNGALFARNELAGSNFQHVHAEKSMWQQLHFSGDFSHAMLNGSKLSDCTIRPSFIQFGCDWELVEMKNIKVEDALQLLNLRFDEQLIRDNHERTRINDEISQLTQQYKVCLQQSIENHDQTIREDDELTSLRIKIQELENQHARLFTHLNIKLVDINTQFHRLKNDQVKHMDNQDEKIEIMSKRLDKLEQSKSSKTSSQHRTGLSFFQFGKHKNNRGTSEKILPKHESTNTNSQMMDLI